MPRSKKASRVVTVTMSNTLQVHTNIYQIRLFIIASLMILWFSGIILDVDKPSIWDAKTERTLQIWVYIESLFHQSRHFIDTTVLSHQRTSFSTKQQEHSCLPQALWSTGTTVSPQMTILSTIIGSAWPCLVEHDQLTPLNTIPQYIYILGWWFLVVWFWGLGLRGGFGMWQWGFFGCLLFTTFAAATAKKYPNLTLCSKFRHGYCL